MTNVTSDCSVPAPAWLSAVLGPLAAACLLAAPVAVLAAAVTVAVETPAGPLQDAVVIFDPLDVAAAPAHETAIIDQLNKRFIPEISVIRTGTAVTFPNSDHIHHQVFSFSKAKSFSIQLYAGRPVAAEVFDKPGLVVLGCNIHDGMSAFVAVVDSPYFAKLPAAGSAVLELPAGRYRLRLWHPSLLTPFVARDVVVTDTPQALNFALKLTGDHDAVAAWPQ